MTPDKLTKRCTEEGEEFAGLRRASAEALRRFEESLEKEGIDDAR